MYKPPNVISISSDEEEEENTTTEPPKGDEVTLIAINRKRKQPDDLVVVEVADKEPLEVVTTHYENQSHLKPVLKKREKTVGPLIDLLSDEEEEIVFRPVIVTPNPKRIKPMQLVTTTTKAGINVDDAPIISNDISGEGVVNDSISQTISAEDSILKTQLLTKPVSILNNHVKDTTKAKDTRAVKNKSVFVEAHSTLDLSIDEEDVKDLNDTILINNNDDDSSTTSRDDNTPHSTSNTAKAPEANFQRFKSFLRMCGAKITEAKMKKIFREKHSKFLKSYKTAGDFTSTAEFQLALNEATDSVRNCINGFDTVQKVLKIYNALKENRLEPARTLDEDEKLDHLYELLKNLSHRIKVLESVEVDYNDENNSAYCQLQTYKARAVKVHERICEREHKSKYLDRMTYSKLDFDRSSYQAINVAINKKYKNNSVFPTFDDLNRLIRKTVTKSQLEINETSLKREIKTCFVLLGELLQRRRKHELVDSLSDFVDPKATDPALNDVELDKKLRENKRNADKRTQEIIEKYCKIQESGCEPDLSSDPDDSNAELSATSDEENN